MEYTELAFIEPLENFIGKDMCWCAVKFITGKYAHIMKKMFMKCNIFQYYFWGVTFEVVKYNDSFECLEVRDITAKDALRFHIGEIFAITYNNITHDVLASNGFVYNLSESLFYRHCRNVCERIYYEINTSYNFVLRMYTYNGAVLSLLFAKNVTEDSPNYQYALMPGFISVNKKTLKNIMVKSQNEFDKSEKLKQEDIDRIISGLSMPKFCNDADLECKKTEIPLEISSIFFPNEFE